MFGYVSRGRTSRYVAISDRMRAVGWRIGRRRGAAHVRVRFGMFPKEKPLSPIPLYTAEQQQSRVGGGEGRRGVEHTPILLPIKGQLSLFWAFEDQG